MSQIQEHCSFISIDRKMEAEFRSTIERHGTGN
jgi:hypothetical protein